MTAQYLTSIRRLRYLIVTACLAGVSPLHAQSRIIHVESNGIDQVFACGTQQQPCRTITRAIDIAPDDNQVVIEVGPGFYGDVNGDGIASGPEEEPLINGSIITINKPVLVYSRSGPALTIIKAPSNPSVTAVVFLPAGGGSLGTTRTGDPEPTTHGFTIIGTGNPNSRGVLALGEHGMAGNVVLNAGFAGFDLQPDANVIALGRNVSTGNEVGFLVSTPTGSGAVTMFFNTATANKQAGFLISSAGPNVVSFNRAIANGTGFDFTDTGIGRHEIRANVAIGNSQSGIVYRGSLGTVFSGNNIIGNGVEGFRFENGSRNNILRDNNIFGNGTAGIGCGLRNETGLRVDAIGNWWGGVRGPGKNPADRAHLECESPGSDTRTIPWLTQPGSLPFPSPR
jgi:hypothetical protein